MPTSTKPEPDISRGCAGGMIGHLHLATHPHRTAIRELTLGGRAKQGEDDYHDRHAVAQQPAEQRERFPVDFPGGAPMDSGARPFVGCTVASRRHHLGVYVRNGQMLTSVRRNTTHMTW